MVGDGAGDRPGGRRRVRIVALGNPDRGDDGAALALAAGLRELLEGGGGDRDPNDGMPGQVTVVMAGKPGPGLLDLLPPEEFCILLDATCTGVPPGTIYKIPLGEVTTDLLPDLRVSSHGFGPGEALALGRALGRTLPPGYFLGIEGKRYGPGEELSLEVLAALPGCRESVLKILREA